MRKTFYLYLLIFSVSLFGFNNCALAENDNVIRFKVGVNYYKVNSTAHQMDAITYVSKGRTLVPIRYLANGLGIKDENIKYENSKVTLSNNGMTLGLTIGSNILTVGNSVTSNMDVTPEIVNGRIYLPARFVSEAFGYRVDWDQDLETVRVYPEGMSLKPEGVMLLEEIVGITMVPPKGLATWWSYSKRSETNQTYNGMIMGYNFFQNDIKGEQLRIFLATNSTDQDVNYTYDLLRAIFPNDSNIPTQYYQMVTRKRQDPKYDQTVRTVSEGRSVVLICSRNDDRGAYAAISRKGVRW